MVLMKAISVTDTLVCLFPVHIRAAFSKLCSGLRLNSTVSWLEGEDVTPRVNGRL